MKGAFILTAGCRFSEAHLACGGVYELGGTVHGTSQDQSAILVARQAGELPLVAILT